jgi:DNA-binding transcriptional LysR family regulator
MMRHITYPDGIELRQLRYLLAIAEQGSFSGAARQLHVVQPAVSQQIRKLELELGEELVRRNVPATLTPLGARVATRASAALAEIDAIAAETTGERGVVSGRLRVGSMQWLGPVRLPELLGEFSRRFPTVTMSLEETTTPRMLEDILHGRLDVAFVSLGGAAVPASVEIAELATEELVLAGAPGTELEDLDRAELDLLSGEPFVAFARGMSLRATVDRALSDSGVRPREVLASNEPLTVRELAAQGVGYALLPVSVAAASGPPLRTARAAPVPVTRKLGLAWHRRRQLSRAAREFVAMVAPMSSPSP